MAIAIREDGQEIIYKKYAKMNLQNYDETCANFNYEKTLLDFEGLGGGKYNISYEAVDRHCKGNKKDKVAMYYVPDGGKPREEITFDMLRQASNKLAQGLLDLGVKKTDRVFAFLPRIPEVFYTALAVPKIGGIFGPLFSAFGPEAVKDRLIASKAKVLVTTPELWQRIQQISDSLTELKYIVMVTSEGERELAATQTAELANYNFKLVDYETLTKDKSPDFDVMPMDLEDPFIVHYTSGSTGKPKGVVHVHKAMVGHYQTSKWVLDLQEDDVYWCTADPGWVTGTSYGTYGPWLNGASMVVYEGGFDALTWYKIIDENKVTIWYTAPTALRLLMKAGDDVTKQCDFSSLRHICSVGEPLNAEVIRWAINIYPAPIHDTWWQTETGSMMIVNYPCVPIKPGSMGKPFPGIKAAIVNDKGEMLPPGEVGFLALKPGWPSMMRQLWKDPDKYNEYFKIPGWYASGDTAYMDEEGYFWFVGRADDVINTSGHRVGPFEVESALVEHPAVAEAGVIGKPDRERGEIIKAFITLRDGYEPNDGLLKDIKEHVKKNLAFHAYPREIEFRKNLPKTRSGKIMRRVLKAWDLGLPTGDLSTMED